MRRLYKESLTDWILDTQPHTAPLDAKALIRYIAAHQADPYRLAEEHAARLRA